MKPEELMIGDWVQCEYHENIVADAEMHPCKIFAVCINNGNFVDLYDTKTKEVDIEVRTDDCKPIPITSEILKKNFEKKVFYDIYGIYDDYFDFDIRLLTDGYYMCNYHNCEFNLPDTQIVGIGYVHELQHVLRLCGINKMIEL